MVDSWCDRAGNVGVRIGDIVCAVGEVADVRILEEKIESGRPLWKALRCKSKYDVSSRCKRLGDFKLLAPTYL